MNNVTLTGRITKDIELRHTQSNTAVARFTLAVQRDYKNAEGNYDADFIGCTAFKNTAELLDKYCAKGDKIGVIGSIRTGSYDKDGKKVYTTDVFVDRIEFIESKRKDEKSEEPAQDDFSYTFDDGDIPF